MKRNILLPLALLMILALTQASTNQDTTIQNFTLVNAIDHNNVSLYDYSKSKAVVIIFSSPSCAFFKIYEDRLLSLAKEFNGKEVNFLLINPNNPNSSPEDNENFMVSRAKEKAYPFPFLVDGDQKIAHLFGATKTPEAFVLKNVNGSFVLKYKGAIDDNPQLASEVSSFYLKDAINAVITHAPVKIAEKRATGCMIKK
jgi:peroxiredoxin